MGVSAARLDLAEQAIREGASYIAFGRFFDSNTKPGAPSATPELLAEARAHVVDQRPLSGLPVAVKDLFNVRGLRCTFGGSPLFLKNVSAQDDPHVLRLREAGAIIVGKTNSPEWGAGSNTFNSLMTTRNPHDLLLCAGGSSGGSAAALASYMVPLCDGSDLASSLRNPAAFCGCYGFRPTARSAEMSTEGAMARTFDDINLLHAVIFNLPAFHGTRYRLEQLGCQVRDAHPQLHDVDEVFEVLRARGFRENLGSIRRAKATVLWNIEQGRKQTPQQEERARLRRLELQRQVDEWFNDYDYLCTPAAQVMPFDVQQEYPTEICGKPMQNYIQWLRNCSCITVLGLPSLSVPIGKGVGMQIIGRAGAEASVLRLARALGQ